MPFFAKEKGLKKQNVRQTGEGGTRPANRLIIIQVIWNVKKKYNFLDNCSE